jgi:hypothetical protein
VVGQLALIAFADITDVFDPSGRPLPLADVPPHVRAALARYTVRTKRSRVRAADGEVVPRTVEVIEVRLVSKIPALAALARYLGRQSRLRPGGAA